MDKTISCLIPAWNEAARIGAVLNAVADHPALAEVIVIDDGSTDGTATAATRQGVRVIRQPNGGKASAVFHGASLARGTHILLLDADLIGLTAQDVDLLVAPVLADQCDATISLRGNSPWLWRAMGVDYISGERVLPAAHLRATTLPGFGLEVHINRQWRLARTRVRIVRCPKLASPAKARKKGLLRGIAADIGMMRDIFRTASVTEVARQLVFFVKVARTQG